MQPVIYESEYNFCKILWENEPVKSTELVKLCKEKLEWKKSTTYTVIKRLSERGIIKSENAIVTSLVKKEDAQTIESVNMVDTRFDGSLPEFVAAFVRARGITDKTTLGHAEITAIKKASRYMNDWRLEDCTIYVTLEPCQMCAGAIVQARIPRVVIGSMNSKAGCAGSIINLLNMPQFNHQAEVVRGVCDEECSTMLSTFFKELRQKKKAEKASIKGALKINE